MTSKDELNILILGETGVGKSTFINGFANYLMFCTLDEAMEHDALESLIPSSFIIVDNDYKEVKVTTGNSTNENSDVGQSATQSSMVYTFAVGKTKVRLIDTPGIGDTRGPKQDKKNFENIISTLSNYDDLHGIIILLKPNNARLDLMFRFCIKELLTHLHKSAVHNIVFGFTNTRGTLYKPGDTLPALRQLLQENSGSPIELSKETMYCFDSESFRFLAASKNGVEFSPKTKSNFAESWDYSVLETKRIISYFEKLTPHSVKNTVCLNAARDHIVQLTKPLAEIMRNVTSNVKLCNDKLHELGRTKMRGKELAKQLFVNKTDLSPIMLVQPRTVCTNSSCVEVRDFDGIKKIKYIRICHNDCFIPNIQVDTLNAAGLIKCWAMDGTICRHELCRHSYKEHMHVLYELEEVTKQVKDLNRQSELDLNKSDAEKKQEFIDELNQRKNAYQKEHMIIEQAAAKFGRFLKLNAITTYNNATIEYLEHLIKEEKGKVQAGGSRSVLDALESSLEAISEQINAIDRTIGKTADENELMDPESITKLAKELYTLKHFGASLKKLKEFSVTVVSGICNEVPFKPKIVKKAMKRLNTVPERRDLEPSSSKKVKPSKSWTCNLS